MLRRIHNSLRDKDAITAPSALKWHFDRDRNLKTTFGGILTIAIQLYVVYIAVDKVL